MLNNAASERSVQVDVSVRESSLLKHDAGTLGDQNEVAETVHDHRAIALLDHIREHREHRRETRVAVGENFDDGALDPVDGRWRVDRRLDVRSIEVHRGGLGLEKCSPSGTLDRGLKKERDILRVAQYIP